MTSFSTAQATPPASAVVSVNTTNNRKKMASRINQFKEDFIAKPLPANSPLKVIPDALDRFDDIFSAKGLMKGLSAAEDAKIAGWTGLGARLPGLAALSYGAETYNALAHHHWPTAVFAGIGTMISGTLTGLLDLRATDHLKRWASKLRL